MNAIDVEDAETSNRPALVNLAAHFDLLPRFLHQFLVGVFTGRPVDPAVFFLLPIAVPRGLHRRPGGRVVRLRTHAPTTGLTARIFRLLFEVGREVDHDRGVRHFPVTIAVGRLSGRHLLLRDGERAGTRNAERDQTSD